MIWERKGLLLSPQAGHHWWARHAQAPTVLTLSDRLWRIYFSGRDRAGLANMLAIDVDPSDDMRIVARHLNPMLEKGPLGAFDHMGLGPSCVVVIGGQVHLYYTGVSVRRDVPYQPAIGVMVSDDGLSFRRLFPGPVRGTGPLDPYFTSVATVLALGGSYRMWYVSGAGWRHDDGPTPSYGIRTCASPDGRVWDSLSAMTVSGEEDDSVLGRPFAVQTPGGVRLWYCRRRLEKGDGNYRLESVAVDEAGVAVGPVAPVVFASPPAPGDFDGEAQAYGCVTPWGDDLILFYNGDEFGKGGFGWARAAGAARKDE